MNWASVEGNWEQYKNDIQEQWGRLTTERLDKIAGRRDDLASEIQAAYGISRHAAEWQLSGWQGRHNALETSTK